jgi:hypothetical protein
VTVASALAPVLVASLAQLAALDADVGLRVDGFSSTIDAPRTPTVSRTAFSAIPVASAILYAGGLRLTGTYAPRIWTSDVEARPSPTVDQTVEARAATYHDRPWRAEANASATRGRTDPLADPSRVPGLTGDGQVPIYRALSYEELRAGLLADVRLGERTIIGGRVYGQSSRGVAGSAALVPAQRGAWLETWALRLLTEHDSLRVSLFASGALTARPAAPDAQSGSATAMATWRRRLAPALEGWLGAGASWLYSEPLSAGSRTEVQPAAEAGFSRAGEATTAEASARATTYIDRTTGAVSPSLDARFTLSWRTSERLTVSSTAAGGARTNSETRTAWADARLAWTVRPSLSLETGVVVRGQHDNAPGQASFREVAVFASVVYRRESLFGAAHAVPGGEAPLTGASDDGARAGGQP